MYSHVLLIPAGYLRIGWFLRKQNQKVVETLGVQKQRRQRNIVSISCTLTKCYNSTSDFINLVFNLVAWGLDLMGDILGLIFYRCSCIIHILPIPKILIFPRLQVQLSAGDRPQYRDPVRPGASGLSIRSQGLQEDHPGQN